MIVYLAGIETYCSYFKTIPDEVYNLCTFWYYHNKKNIPDFAFNEYQILDSGAFSAINDKTGKYKNFDWDLYVKKYIEFINITKRKLFFELDIDCVVGLNKVEYYRKQIEDGTGIAPIVCWHSNRGSDYWVKCCEEYDYVAIGTTNANSHGRKIRKNPQILHWFINHAKKNNTKVHGLGFTNIDWLQELKFDSVDSTSWISGQKFGVIHKWNGVKMKQYKKKENQIMINPDLRLKHNFNEWVLFQKYAINNL